jgi:hypothetical protein
MPRGHNPILAWTGVRGSRNRIRIIMDYGMRFEAFAKISEGLSRSVLSTRTLHTARSLEAMREGKFAKRLDKSCTGSTGSKDRRRVAVQACARYDAALAGLSLWRGFQSLSEQAAILALGNAI